MFTRLVSFGIALAMVPAAWGSPSAAATPSSGGEHAAATVASPSGDLAPLAAELGLEFVEGSTSRVILERNGRKYLVDLASHTIAPVTAPARGAETPTASSAGQPEGSAVFKQNCAQCHGEDGKGIASIMTPNFTDPKVQASLTDAEILTFIHHGVPNTLMPAWSGKLSEAEMNAVAGYIRSLGKPESSESAAAREAAKPKVYEPGDDVLFTLPTGRRVTKHGFYVNFAHRFAFDPAFSGTARGGALLGLDGFAIPSFGFRYGVTDRLSVSAFRAPSIIARPIQFMAAYNILDEQDGRPLNMAVRVSMEGENNFSKNYTENLEGIFSRSLTSRAQVYLVPTLSLNDRPLQQVATFRSSDILDLPGHNAFSLGVGAAVDIRPTAAVVAEVIPTLVNGRPLGIHRPAYAIGIQKKIWRHAFTLGFTTSPGTTVSQRAGTRASFLGDPTADKPSGLVIGFDLTRQTH